MNWPMPEDIWMPGKSPEKCTAMTWDGLEVTRCELDEGHETFHIDALGESW